MVLNWSFQARWQRYCQLLFLMLCAAKAGAQSCQHINILAREIPSVELETGMLELDDGGGVGREIDLFPGGRDPDGDNGWACRFLEEFPNQLLCHGSASGQPPRLVLKLHAPMHPGRMYIPRVLHWAGWVIA